MLVGDIGLLTGPVVRNEARRSASSAETGGLVASGEGTEGIEPVKDGALRKAGTGGGGMRPAAAAAAVEDDDKALGAAATGDVGGGEVAVGVGMAAELPPGGLNSA